MGTLATIEPGQGLFSKICLDGCDIVVPFECRRCGTRCRRYVPSISEEGILEIARFLDRPGLELFREYRARFRQGLTSHPAPCPFLERDNLCAIYRHPRRPAVCALYPFSYGGLPVEGCPGLDEHREILRFLQEGRRVSAVYDSAFCPDRTRRPIPGADWNENWTRFLRAGPSRGLRKRFRESNGVAEDPSPLRARH
jgi:Fe-S-cluster containining protein